MPTSDSRDRLSRREAVHLVSALLGGVTLVGGDALWRPVRAQRVSLADADAAADPAPDEWTAAQRALLDEAAETILPRTATPGAKDAQCGAFIALMVTDTYEPAHQRIFRRGLAELDAATRAAHGVPFVEATPAQRLALIERFDREAYQFMRRRPDDEPPHWFRMLKELTMLGFFTSEAGMTQALRYVESPGRFDPCVPHAPGERDWAGHA
jgi:hypothetical protein